MFVHIFLSSITAVIHQKTKKIIIIRHRSRCGCSQAHFCHFEQVIQPGSQWWRDSVQCEEIQLNSFSEFHPNPTCNQSISAQINTN